ncbi:MAG: chemotaxis protein CheW [Comamonas sp.]
MTRDNELHIDSFIPFMRDVAHCERSLHELNLMWRLIESTAKMNCADEAQSMLPMMAATRKGFQRLEKDLVNSMVSESVAEVMDEITTCAHHVIDILVRNLYERTADVGFLATDLTLCNYVAGITSNQGITDRLREYRSKYTVYDEIMLLDHEGGVLAQIDESSPVEGSKDPVIAATLDSESYIETFRDSDLRPFKRQALLYTQRMLHPQTGAPCGLLCLSFDFEGEMQGIFAGSSAAEGRSIALLLDAHDRVIASSDTHWVAIGTQVPTNQSGAPQLYIHCGRTYLVQTVDASGYQGYPGPAGWKGQVMIPIDQAFGSKIMRCVDALPADVAQGLLSHAKSFCPPLYDIIQAADSIRRVVWNGQVMTAGRRGGSERLKCVLEQIGETGARTNQVFTQSIRDLYDTVLSAGLRDSQSLTQLLVNLLDRNLYERANDCRWWALTPVLRQVLTEQADKDSCSQDLLEQASKVLEHINSLYTVYIRLMVYDRHGRIVCASHPKMGNGSSVLDQQIDAATLHAVMQLNDSQSYYVSPWTEAQAGAEGATYVYHAPIRRQDGLENTVGGIGIVFNAIPELQSMLASTLVSKPKTRALYVNRQGDVLASTDAATPPGSRIQLPTPHLLDLPVGHSDAAIAVYQNEYCIVGCSVSRGYREFKTTDGYRDDVLAISIESFGAVQTEANTGTNQKHHEIQASASVSQGIEMATFYVGAQLFALRAETVLEALPASAISPVSAGRLPYCLGTLARHAQGQVTGYVWVFDLGELFTGQRTQCTEQSQVVILEHGTRKLGILVSALHGVHQFRPDSIIASPSMAGGADILVNELIKANEGSFLIQCISPEGLLHTLQRKPVVTETVSAHIDSTAAEVSESQAV